MYAKDADINGFLEYQEIQKYAHRVKVRIGINRGRCKLGVLRAIGYFFGILFIISGILTIWIYGLGLVGIIVGAIMIYVLKKGGQVSSMQKQLKEIKTIEQQNQQIKLDEMRKDALSNRGDTVYD